MKQVWEGLRVPYLVDLHFLYTHITHMASLLEAVIVELA